MAGNLSDYLENKLLDHFLATTSYTAPSNVYVALMTVAEDDTGSAGTEVTGGSYARQSATFDAAASGATQNSSNLDFTGMPACTVVGIAIYDASSAGNLLVHGTLTANKTLDAGDTLRIATGDLDISIN
jgi:hypothetical protein